MEYVSNKLSKLSSLARRLIHPIYVVCWVLDDGEDSILIGMVAVTSRYKARQLCDSFAKNDFTGAPPGDPLGEPPEYDVALHDRPWCVKRVELRGISPRDVTAQTRLNVVEDDNPVSFSLEYTPYDTTGVLVGRLYSGGMLGLAR